MDKSQDAIAAQLQALRENYARRLPGHLAELLNLGEALGRQGEASETLEQLHRQLHKLAGSAGSFGYSQLGKQARQLEQQAQQWLEQGLPGEGVLRVFAVAVGALARSEPVLSEPLSPVVSPPNAPVQSQVWLLEDDLELAEEIQLVLSHFGHELTHFSNLADVEQALVHRLPDFLIVDILFSAEGRQSLGLVSQLQASAKTPIPAIFISVLDDFDSYLAAVRAGAVGYFVKPLDITHLVECLELQLERHRAQPYRVLIVDDDETLAAHYQLVLSAAGMQVRVLTSPKQILEDLHDFKPEMVLLDLHMPGCEGPELARVIRLNNEWLRIPIAYLSAEQDLDTRIKAMGLAGDDFLSKPISDRELVAAVSVRAARSRQLSEAIDRDSLTGLLKHSRIKEQVSIELLRAARQSQPVCVAMIDLDHFKVVNDTYGHGVGDRVIKALAQMLRQRLRKTDSVGRYGGEEFMAVLPDCTLAAAQALLEEIRQAFASLVFNVGGQQFGATLSAGLVGVKDSSAKSDQVLQLADEALYQAKREGRDRICTRSLELTQ